MKRTVILLLLFLLLGGGVLYYMKGKTQSQTTGNFEKLFTIDNTDEIYKIFLADREGNQTTLQRVEGDQWTYNNKYPVRPNAIDFLLQTMRRVRVKYRPPQAAKENMVTALATLGIKVEAYDKQGNKMICYYVGGSTQDGLGTIMIMEDSDEPLVTHIPDWSGGLYSRYSLRGDEWRDKAIFRETPENIQSVSIEYRDPSQSANSFVLERTGKNNFSVKPFYPTTPAINKPVQTGKVEAFLVGFEKKVAEDWQNNIAEKAAVRQQLPFCTINLTDIKGNKKEVKFFPIDPEAPLSKDGQIIQTGGSVFRYHADVNGEDLMLVQQGVFGELFWAYDSFF